MALKHKILIIDLGAPQLLNFNPYQVKEISDIIKGRLNDLQLEINQQLPGDEEKENSTQNHSDDGIDRRGGNIYVSTPTKRKMAGGVNGSFKSSDESLTLSSSASRDLMSLEGKAGPMKTSTPVSANSTLSLMHPSAIEFCARKASGTGDLRKALDVCRYVIIPIY